MSDYTKIYPAFEKNNVVLTLTSSDLYSPYVGVLLESVVKNSSKKNNYDIFIFETDITCENKSILNSIVSDHENFSLRFIDISEDMEDITFTICNPRHAKYNFYRLMMLSVLVNFDKAIYFDSDLIIEADIADLFATDIENYYLAAAKDIRYAYRYNVPTHWSKDYCDNVLKLKVPYEYFSSGVMVMNLAEMRKDFTSKQLIELSASDQWKTVEQDVLNMLMQGRVKFLPFEWNYTIETNEKGEVKAPKEMFAAYKRAQENPKIVHYVGNSLPCNKPYIQMAELFWKYARDTDFFELLICRMNDIMLKKDNPEAAQVEGKKDIKVFVSHRIDLKSETLDNPLFLHMRCGAMYDDSKSKIVGDNIGDNISERRNTFCELTVQYWAWKNYHADYYGLFQYRRYLSFRKRDLPEDRFFVKETQRMGGSAPRYGLLNANHMEEMIREFDAVVPKCTPIQFVPVLMQGQSPLIVHSVYDFWINKTDQIDKECLDFAINLVKDRQPKYYPYLKKYLNGRDFRAANLFIMRKELFFEMCEFQFDILFELEKKFDMSEFTDEIARMPGFVGEILYAAYVLYLEEQGRYRIKPLQLVFFTNPKKQRKKASQDTGDSRDVRKEIQIEKEAPVKKTKKTSVKRVIKGKIIKRLIPAYRVAASMRRKMRTIEKKQDTIQRKQSLIAKKQGSIAKKQSSIAKSQGVIVKNQKLVKSENARQRNWDKQTITGNNDLKIACTALEIRDIHKASFLEYKYCNSGRDVAVVATGPSMAFYEPIKNAVHIGVNRAFKNERVKLDYFFITDFEHGDDWMEEIKDYDCVKFFGQYPAGVYRDRFQASEQMIIANNARRYFQGAPSEDIHVNIEFHPLMAYYSVTFQALHFAIYTNAKRIYLVGCDCSLTGHFDGKDQHFANPLKWLQGYQKFNYFVKRFYPDTEIISVNPVGLKGLFRDVYTESYLAANPEIDASTCEILDLAKYEELINRT